MNIQGRVAIITGASSGIGAATARELARQGAKVVLAARRTDHLNMLVEEIVREGGCALAVPTDVRERGNIDRLVQTAAETFGRIDLLINNAGVGGGAIVFHYKFPIALRMQQVDHNSFRPAVFADVYQSLLCDPRQFAAHRLRQQYLFIVHQQSGDDSGFTLEPLHCVAQKRRQSVSIDVNRLQGANARTGSRGPNYRQSNSASSAYNHCAMALQATDLWSEAVSRGHRPASWQCDNATAREQIWK